MPKLKSGSMYNYELKLHKKEAFLNPVFFELSPDVKIFSHTEKVYTFQLSS